MKNFSKELRFRGCGTKVIEQLLPVLPGGSKRFFYGFDMARMLKGLLAELLFGNMRVGIPTYLRDNSDVLFQVDSANTVTNGKRMNNFSESNREELEKTIDWV